MSTKVFKEIPGKFLGIADGSPEFNENFLKNARAFMGMFDSSTTFFGDSLFTCSKSLGFLKNERFREIVDNNAKNDIELTTIWRTFVLCWAAESCLVLEGDFVECGCYTGHSVHCIADFVTFNTTGKHYYLYDVFENPPDAHSMHLHSPHLYDEVKERFCDYPKIIVTKGAIPEILDEVAPKKVSFMHIDMNSVSAEIGALEYLYDRVTVGGIIILDDYGYYAYRAQKEAEDRFFAERGLRVLELPTGQGLVLKR